MYFESHAHYDDPRFDEDRGDLLERLLPQAGIDHIVNIGADMESTRSSVALAVRYAYVYAAIGVHPHNAKEMADSDFQELETLARHEKVVAVGEIGLDYYYDHSPRETQQKRFREQLDFARQVHLPVVIHCRDAQQECFDILQDSGVGPACGGVIHCYAGSPEMAKEYVKMGFYLGIGGVLTYHNAKKLRQVVAETPLERLLLETDCPYLPPAAARGQRNDSRNLSFVAAKIAELKETTAEEVARVTGENGKSLFDIN